jgi:hypothetical protein
MVPRRLHTLLAVLLLALAASVIAACGGGDDGGSGSDPKGADSILSDTFGGGHPVKSGNLALDFALTARGAQALEKPVKLKLTGPFQSVGKGKLPKFSLSLALDSGGQTFTAGATSTGTKGYLQVEGTSYELPDDVFSSFKKGFQQDQASDDKKDTSTLASLGIHPRAWLKDAKTEGDEDVEGTSTHHVTATIDVAKFLGDLNSLLGKAGALGGSTAGVPTGISADTRRVIENAVTKATFDVWSGAHDGTLRRLAIHIAFDVPEADRAKAGGLQSGDLTIDVTIADLNKAQDIPAPENVKPFSELTAKLQSLAGSSSGSGSSSSSGSSAGDAGDYASCVQAAGSDVAKIQACGKYLGK